MSLREGTPSLISQLHHELRELWREPSDPNAQPRTRICTMNLKVVASSRALLERYIPVVDDVTASIPARVIASSIQHDGSDAMTGSATAVCSLQGTHTICSERITLHATGEACAGLASAMEAFLVPEIPSVLVWLGRVHVDDPMFGQLASACDRVVLDSAYTSLASLLRVTAWARQQSPSPPISDMAWTRLSPWLEMIARLFDAPSTQPLAHKVTSLRICQAAEAHSRLGPEAALLLGWLATRLGWKVSRLGAQTRLKRSDGSAISIECTSVAPPPGVAPHTLASVHIVASDNNCAMHGNVERELASGGASAEPNATTDADVLAWSLSMPDGSVRQQRVRLGTNKAAKWLERTLHRPSHDAAFDESVAFAEQVYEEMFTS